MCPTITPRSILCRSPRSPLHPWCRLRALHCCTAIVLLLILTTGNLVTAQNTPGSNKQPFFF